LLELGTCSVGIPRSSIGGANEPTPVGIERSAAGIRSATRPEDVERGWERTGNHGGAKMLADEQLDAFAQVSGSGPGALIIRRSLVRVQPAPHRLRTSEAVLGR
jgi:hypothetical protein